LEEEEHAEEMRSRGFAEVTERMIYGRNTNIGDLPHPVVPPSAQADAAAAAASATARPALPLYQQHPPINLKVPSSIPTLRKGGPGDNRAKIVECFELKVVDEAENTVYSPMRLWRDFKDDTGSFNSRCRAYYTIKKNIPMESSDRNNLSKLKSAASKHSSIKAKKAELGKKFCFFDVCCDLYQSGGTN
jgi:hypothetical protein